MARLRHPAAPSTRGGLMGMLLLLLVCLLQGAAAFVAVPLHHTARRVGGGSSAYVWLVYVMCRVVFAWVGGYIDRSIDP